MILEETTFKFLFSIIYPTIYISMLQSDRSCDLVMELASEARKIFPLPHPLSMVEIKIMGWGDFFF